MNMDPSSSSVNEPGRGVSPSGNDESRQLNGISYDNPPSHMEGPVVNPAEFINVLQTTFQQMQDRFTQMMDTVMERMDEMSERLNELEKEVTDLVNYAGGIADQKDSENIPPSSGQP